MKRIRYGKACRNAIRRTLSYSAIFKYPLSFYQLGTYLVTSNRVSPKILNKELHSLVKLNIVRESENRYFLHDIEPVNIPTRELRSKELLESISPVLKVLYRIPWIKMIAVTGSLAAYNAEDGADIDLFIVTSKNRLWITRLFVVTVLKLFNKYPNIAGEKEKICANLYVDESNLEWDKTKRSVYIAHEIVRMQPVYSIQETYFKFLKANSWISDYFANFSFPQIGIFDKNTYPDSPILNLVENILMTLQIKHMRNKITTEEVSKHIIHFKKNDNSEQILSKFSKFSKYSH